MRRRLALVVLVVVTGCGGIEAAPVTSAAAGVTTTTPALPSTTSTPAATDADFDCPVTVPGEPLVVPDPYPVAPSFGVWYGTEDLWTVLEIDGTYAPRKGVFWSKSFPGGDVEEQPDLEVTWQRLDGPKTVITEGNPGTNAYTPEEGWFMMAGIDPDKPGCWEVTATYRGASLSYVYDSR